MRDHSLTAADETVHTTSDNVEARDRLAKEEKRLGSMHLAKQPLLWATLPPDYWPTSQIMPAKRVPQLPLMATATVQKMAEPGRFHPQCTP